MQEGRLDQKESKSPNPDEKNVPKRTVRHFLPSMELEHKIKTLGLPPALIVNKEGTSIGKLSYVQSEVDQEIHRLLSTGPKRRQRSFLRESDRRFTQYGEIADEDVSFIEQKVMPISDQLRALPSLPVSIAEKERIRERLIYAAAVPEPSFCVYYANKIADRLYRISNSLVIWTKPLKRIEGLYGTSIVSYFFFLRWIVYLNVIICVVFLALVVIPQIHFPDIQHVLMNYTNYTKPHHHEDDYINPLGVGFALGRYTPPVADLTENFPLLELGDKSIGHIRLHNLSDYCAAKYLQYLDNTTSWDFLSVLQNVIQGMGWMEYTLMFIGFYSPLHEPEHVTSMFNIAVAYLDTLLVLYIISIYMMINYIGKGVEESILSQGASYYNYSGILYSSWDYSIMDPEGIKIHHCGIYLELMEYINEAARMEEVAKWSIRMKIRMYAVRFAINAFVLVALVIAYFVLYTAAYFQIKEMRNQTLEGISMLLVQFLPATVFTCLNLMLPAVFDKLVVFENYGYQKAINVTLVRTVFIRLASIVILMISFYNQITCKPRDICHFGLKTCPSPLCWETYVGQQMYKLVMMDLFVVLAITFCWEAPRRYLVDRYKGKYKFFAVLGRPTFDIPTQVLALVYSQTLCWIGSFFCPLLPVICILKIVIIFYAKKYTLVVNCVPPKIPYKSSKSNAVFIAVLMLSFLTTVAVLGYTVSSMETSPGCTPFRYYFHMTDCIEDLVMHWDARLGEITNFVFSAGFAVPAIIVLCVIIYYYLTVTYAHRCMMQGLTERLILESQDREFLLRRLEDLIHLEEQYEKQK